MAQTGEKIAVVGLGALFPGANTPDQFWEKLVANKSAIRQATEADFGIDPALFFSKAKGKLDTCYSLRGGFIDDFAFNPHGYKLDPQTLLNQDRLGQWCLYVAQQALKDSGYWGHDVLKRCGVIMGTLSFPTHKSWQILSDLYADIARQTVETLTGEPISLPTLYPENLANFRDTVVVSTPSALVAQAVGLNGPHYSLDAACASSLYAVKLACDELRAGNADMMLAGAVSAAHTLQIHIGFSYFHAYPLISELSAPLDQRSNGLTSSEGAGMVVLKRLSDAERDGDTIHALIETVSLSNDGKGEFLLTPNPKGQRLAFERAYSQTGFGPEFIDYLECHATGTRLGDKVELNSIGDFFGSNAPYVGSVKSTIGHLLTASGMASMLKVILGMKHRMLTATTGIESPLQSADGQVNTERIVRKNRSWPARGEALRAGINAFGFGGTNAHMILSSSTPESKSQATVSPQPPVPLAIVGMDLHMGDCENLDDFYLSLLLGRQHFRELPPERWKGMDALNHSLQAAGMPAMKHLRGAWVGAFDIDLLRFKIQPNEAERTSPQQILMLKVADRAIRDAGLDKLEGQGANVAVIIAMETELEIHHRLGRGHIGLQVQQAVQEAGVTVDESVVNALNLELKNAIFSDYEGHSISEHTGFIGNIIASRIASLMDFTGPAFTVSSNENGVYKALEIARRLLTNREVDAVVLGAVDLGGGFESVLARQAIHPVQTGPVSMGWNHKTTGWAIGEGAGAIVLKRADETATDRVYARLDDLAIVQSDVASLRGTIREETVCDAATQVLNRQQVKPSDIGLLEVSASGIAAEDQPEMVGLSQAYGGKDVTSRCALGSSKAHIGHTYTASGIASLIKTALSLYYRFLPGVPNWEGPTSATTFASAPFYVPTFSRPWVLEKGQHSLRAAINGLAADGTSAHVLLSEGDHPKSDDPSPYLLRGGERLFPIRSNTISGLIEQLAQIQSILSTKSFTQISDQLCTNFQAESESPTQIVVLVASSTEELKREIRYFHTNLVAKPEATLQTPAGSYYTPKQLGNTGKLALVYPGSGSPYVGAGAMLFQAFPGLYDMLQKQGLNMADALGPNLYPRHLFAPDSEEKQELQRRFQTNALAMMLTGGAFSGFYTELLQTYLGVQANSVLGYSLGEVSAMYYCQGIWKTAAIEEKVVKAPLFREKVGGRMTLLAEFWQLPEAEARERWSSRLIHLPNGMPGYATLADWFRQKIASSESRVFLTFINTDTEIIISGDTADLDQLLTRYGLTGVTLTINNVVHHDFCRQVASELVEMHRLDILQLPGKTMYSSITAEPLAIDSDTLANNSLEVCCRPVDWPRIIRKLSDDNHKLFIEVGVNATCSRWISEVLRGKEQAVLPMDRKGASVLQSLTAFVAKLLAHGVRVNIAPFYTHSLTGQAPRKTLIKRLRTGGPRFESLVLTDENRRHFAQKSGQRAPVLAETPTITFPKIPQLTSMQVSSFAIEQPQITYEILDSTPPQLAENGLSRQDYSDPDRLLKKTIIWNETDLLTFASGRIRDVFGEEYAIIDTYSRRVMLPMPPYLLVSRVTSLDATVHDYKPSRITTEYDIPYGSTFTTDGQIPGAVAVESGQCDLLLISYLGVDFQNKGEYVYRLLDCTLTFTDDLPFEGQTLRYDISIDRFVRNEQNLLFFFSYRCYVEDRLVLKMDGGCAGFFSDAELALGQGVVFTAQERRQRETRPRQFFTPLLECTKTAFSTEEMMALVRGDLVRCFGNAYFPNGRNSSLRLPPKEILMLDRITHVDRQGGSSGLGFIEAEKDLHPDDWYFPCHFRDDEVLAGSLQAEGGSQLLRFYMLLLGMQRLTKDARFQPVLGKPQKVRCRKEVPARVGKLIYQLDVREIGLVPEPYVIADLTILYEGQIAVFFENLGLRLQEKDQPSYLKNALNRQGGVFVKPVDKPVLFNEYHLTQFALGPVHKCFGEDYAVFEGRALSRQPNTDLQLISRVLSTTGQRYVFNNKPVMISEYDVPTDAWYYQQNAAPVMPYSVLMEIALQPCGFLGAYLGSTLQFPEKDLFFRNLDGDGDLLRPVDLRGKTITNQVCLQSHTALNGTVLQRYSFALSIDGTVFYQGNASFGFFTKDDLANQVGLDQGIHVAPWYVNQPADQLKSLRVKLDSLFGRVKLFQSVNSASPQLHLAGNQLNLLDTALIVKEGGKYGNGYVFAQKAIDPSNWFFTCHFYQDPVMPGSLGVEAMVQAMQLFALQQGLAADLSGVTFQQAAPHKTVWKYRGQILGTDPEISLEIHIKTIDRADSSVLLTADASLWKGALRIYTVTDLSIRIG
ncbi:beta-ketoacyl synthase N-terminal-like domain-containing protein [Spirosoma harenae]